MSQGTWLASNSYIETWEGLAVLALGLNLFSRGIVNWAVAFCASLIDRDQNGYNNAPMESSTGALKVEYARAPFATR